MIAAPKTAPPRLKITLKFTDNPSAAIAIPKKIYAAWTRTSSAPFENGKKVPRILVKMKPPKNQGIGSFLGVGISPSSLSLTSRCWYQ